MIPERFEWRTEGRTLGWWIAAVALICAGAWRVRVGSGLSLRVPPTVMSASGSNPALAEAVLLFLQGARSRLPVGATVAAVWVGHANLQDETTMLAIAAGQLLDQSVVPAVLRDGRVTARQPPSFVAAVGGELTDGRYEFVGRIGIGAIYRRMR